MDEDLNVDADFEEARRAIKALLYGCLSMMALILLFIFGVVAILKWGFS